MLAAQAVPSCTPTQIGTAAAISSTQRPNARPRPALRPHAQPRRDRPEGHHRLWRAPHDFLPGVPRWKVPRRLHPDVSDAAWAGLPRRVCRASWAARECGAARQAWASSRSCTPKPALTGQHFHRLQGHLHGLRTGQGGRPFCQAGLHAMVSKSLPARLPARPPACPPARPRAAGRRCSAVRPWFSATCPLP